MARRPRGLPLGREGHRCTCREQRPSLGPLCSSRCSLQAPVSSNDSRIETNKPTQSGKDDELTYRNSKEEWDAGIGKEEIAGHGKEEECQVDSDAETESPGDRVSKNIQENVSHVSPEDVTHHERRPRTIP